MGKVNVYLPDDLEAEARAVGVEWSSTFQRAIRQEVNMLTRLAHAETAKKHIAARLLRSKHSEELEGFDEGHKAGTRWAEVEASYSELDRLHHYFERPQWSDIDLEHYPTIQEFLFTRALNQGYDAEPDWFARLNSDSAFDRGFLAGVKAVYDAVSELLSADD